MYAYIDTQDKYTYFCRVYFGGISFAFKFFLRQNYCWAGVIIKQSGM